MVQATIMYLLGNNGDQIPYVVADASAIAKGDVLELADNMVVTAHGGNVDTPVVGIAAHEKVANDGNTMISCITNCVARLTIKAATGTSLIGTHVSMGNAAGVVDVSSSLDEEKGWSLGYALETGTAGQTCAVRIIK